MRRIAVGAAVLLSLALSGCASTTGAAAVSAPSSTPAPSPVGTPAPALDLLPTVWHVHGAAGADPATYLLFTDHGVSVLEPKGVALGEWSTQGDQMLTLVDGGSESIASTHAPTVPWLTDTTTFSRTASGWTLQGADGRVLATLTDDGPAPTAKDWETTPEPVDASARTQIADAVAGPGAGLHGGSLLGRWSVPGLDPKHAALVLKADGSWSIDGGCASDLGDLSGGGDYRVLSGGFLLQTDLPIAGVGCPMMSHPPADSAALLQFWQARSVLLSGDHLTLFDRAGHRIGTLTRVGA